MAGSKYLRWLKEDDLTTKVAKRFASFCDEDIEQRENADSFDAEVYEDAVRLVISKLENKEAPEKQGGIEEGELQKGNEA